MAYKPVVHIQSSRFQTQTICGLPWPARGGRPASDTDPPVVVDEHGSVNPASCRTCLSMFRKQLAAQNKPK